MCFDHSKVEIKGGNDSLYGSELRINFKIPKAECRNDPYDSECVATAKFEKKLSLIQIATLTNRMRFDQLNYSSNPVFKESILVYNEIPK